METPADSGHHILEASKRVAQQALVICENRMELLLLEFQEERERILRALLLSMGLAVFGLLAGVALTVAIVVVCWSWSPLGAMLILVALYGAIAAFFYVQLVKLRRSWESFADTLAEFRKDRECLEKSLH